MTGAAERAILWAAITVAILVAGAALLWQPPFGTAYGSVNALNAVVHGAVGLTFITTGLVVRERPSTPVTGWLMIVVGFLWYVSDLAWLRHPVPFTIAHYGGAFYLGVLAHLFITFPEGRFRSNLDRAVVITLYFWLAIGSALEAAFWDPRDHSSRPSPTNLLRIRRDARLGQTIAHWNGLVAVCFVVVGLVIVLTNWHRATPRQRRALAPVFAMSGPLSAGVLGVIVVATFRLPARLGSEIEDLVPLTLVALPVGFLIGLLRVQLARVSISDLIVQLSKGISADGLHTVLAHTLVDPLLEVGYWDAATETFIDLTGKALDTTHPGTGRAVRIVEHDGGSVAVLVHDEALLAEPELLESVSAAAALSVENEVLHAQVRAQLQEVKESRARIVAADDAARRRMERDLHDGSQQRLVLVAMLLRSACSYLDTHATTDRDHLRSLLGDASLEASGALQELRELAQGIHPAILIEEGLGPALESLTHRCRVPSTLDVSLHARLETTVESTIYFLVAEALANVAKHSLASVVTIDISLAETILSVRVADDGVGGAEPARGTGLRGITDRVAALDGRVRVCSPPGGGTCLEVEIPCGSP